MKNYLSNKNVSLGCCILNIVFAAQAFQSGNWLFFGLCTCFALYCGNNYREANKEIWDD